ncbi:MAG: DNA repair protein RadC [Bacteroidota bacterium]
MAYKTESLSIKNWAEDDQPREKLINKGAHVLSNAELIAILIRVGTKGESAVDLSKRILASVDHNLDELARRGAKELMKFDGVKTAKAVAIVAALELGRRRQLTDLKKRPQIQSSSDAYDLIAPILMDLPHEECWILLLNRANQVIGREQLSLGGMDGTVVDARMIFRKAIEGQATGIILIHNHPSGSLRPSQADIDITKRIRSAGEILSIQVLDHLIIAGKSYYSFADESRI